MYSSVLYADSSKISPELRKASGSSRQQVIVLYKNQPTPLTAAVNSALGAVVKKTLKNLNAVVMSVPLGKIEALSNSADVAYITSDRPLTQLLDYSSAAVNANAVRQSGLTGVGVGIAVIDSGISESPDLSALGVMTSLKKGLATNVTSRVVYHESFVAGGANDAFGHGTHVAGIIAGNGGSSNCFNCTRSLAGLAPGATLVDLQVLDGNGQGTDSSVISAIDRAIELKTLYNIRVINLSLGRPVYESYTQDPLCKAVEAAWNAGIVVTVAAGNSGRDNSVGNQGYGTIQSPANDPYVITVGAMKAMGTYDRSDDLIASYSSKGPSAIDFVAKPDLLAPGNHVVSLESPSSLLSQSAATAVPLSYYQSTTSSTRSAHFMTLNGTSMATPVVSGSIADLLQSEPKLTPDQVKARLMKTSYKRFPTSSTAVDDTTGQTFVSNYDVFTVGAGYLDLGAAVGSKIIAQGTAMSPIAKFNATNGHVYLTFDPSSIWNTNSIWGTQSVWGNIIVGADQSVWGTNSVWGTSDTSAFRAVWSDKGVWGTATDDGDATVDGTKSIWGSSAQTSDSDQVFSVKP